MIVLLQRVKQAEVRVNKDCIAQIDQGILVFIGIEKCDIAEPNQQHLITKLFHKLSHYRIFVDAEDKMNLSVEDIKGQLLIVPQFTLAANTQKGLRPSFSDAAEPKQAEQLFQQVIIQGKKLFPSSSYGQLGADMQISLTNDGPVTFYLKIK